MTSIGHFNQINILNELSPHLHTLTNPKRFDDGKIYRIDVDAQIAIDYDPDTANKPRRLVFTITVDLGYVEDYEPQP